MCKEVQSEEEKKEAMHWEKVDLTVISTQFSETGRHLSDLKKALGAGEASGNNKEQIIDLATICENDLGSSGWIQTFVSENAAYFPTVNLADEKTGPLPDFYKELNPNQKTHYGHVQEFYEDAVKLQPYMSRLAGIISQLQLYIEKNLRLVLLVKQLKSSEIGFNDDLFRVIQNDFKGFSALLRQDWTDLELGAKRSEQYYKNNHPKLSAKDLSDDQKENLKKELKEGYTEERKKDYREMIKIQPLFSSLEYKGNNMYRPKGELQRRMHVIDQFSMVLVGLKKENFGGVLKEYYDNAYKLDDEILHMRFAKHTMKGLGLRSDILGTLSEIAGLAQMGTEILDNFGGASSEAPYGLMKKIDNVKPVDDFGFKPKLGDPWTVGTNFEDTYDQGCKGISQQCKEFVNDHGKKF